MKKLALALLFLVGCAGSEEETGTLDFAVTLNAGQSPSCEGRMHLAMTQQERDADVAVAGSWSCAGTGIDFSGPVTGTWPAGEKAAHLTLATAAGATTAAELTIGWYAYGTARLNGADVPLATAF